VTVPPELDEVAAAAVDRLGDLGDHLARAREVIARLLPDRVGEAGAERPPPLRALDAAGAAVAALGAHASGLRREVAGGGAIDLARDGGRVVVLVPDAATPAEIAAFTAELRRLDERLLRSAALLGLLAGLCPRWAAAGFAPPVVLHTLAETAPRILALGDSLLTTPEVTPWPT